MVEQIASWVHSTGHVYGIKLASMEFLVPALAFGLWEFIGLNMGQRYPAIITLPATAPGEVGF
ncbi:hypothetical protein BO71DRAFT_394075 [Aspergillus ellipticus CBS 707.79]|uniref:Uncharacterized protein n=1 Tax=Aspergillus ellipticus CBS 707.79 TaxID=1448320 RepID=A0A319DTE3_9EURO|nr:hypothetical protein BO71DRAFT_394075 [Aspergillus ellipticus CBS 707.79]